MSSKENAIFYFSGTGNSLCVAKDIAEKIGDVEVLPISKEMDKPYLNKRYETIGVVFPVYMWGVPLIIEEFLNKINIEGNPYIYAVATYGGSQGNSLIQVEKILKERGYTLNSGFGVKMPGNYVVLYGARPEKTQKELFEREREAVDYISKCILGRSNKGAERAGLVMEKWFAPMMYKRIKNLKHSDTNFNVNENCIGCNICSSICKVNNIELKDNKPTWKHNCEGCMACIQYCPKEAINYKNNTVNRKRYRHPRIEIKEMLNKKD